LTPKIGLKNTVWSI